MDTPSIANILVSLDREEIETGCELKGFALRRTYGLCNRAIRPVVLPAAPKGTASGREQFLGALSSGLGHESRKTLRRTIRRVEDAHVDSSSLRSQSCWAAINLDLEIRHLIVNRPEAVCSRKIFSGREYETWNCKPPLQRVAFSGG